MDRPFGLGRRKRGPGINITSLIDVVFLLLIFFMVSSTFREQFALDLELPEAATAAAQGEEAGFELVIREDGAIYLGEMPVRRGELVQTLEGAIRAQDGEAVPVVIRADTAAPYGSVVAVFDALRQVGGTRVVLPTEREEAVAGE